MYALGNKYGKSTLKNCYVIGILEDSIKGIFDCAYQMAETYKAGGGVGVDLSPLRPKNTPVRNSARKSSGSINFMDFYSTITGMIGQQGRIGALLLSLDVSHPDIVDFIKMKGGDDLNKVRFANVSVKITDEFMDAVKNKKPYNLQWDGKTHSTVDAAELWDLIIKNAWKRAEPGLLFWDATIREYPAAQYKEFAPICTNPCGELALSHGDSCCLGSINLGKYVRNPWSNNVEFDYQALDRDVRSAVRFLDNIITLEKCPLEIQQWANDNGRRLGLGHMGLGDVFMKMSMKFDSEEALGLTEKIMKQFMISSYAGSCDLAEEKGIFPCFDAEKHFKSSFIQRLPDDLKERIRRTGLRNVGLGAIAPTGSIALISGATSAIEPVFMIKHVRKTKMGTQEKQEEHVVYHSTAKEYIQKREKEGLSTELPDFFQDSYSVNYKTRIRLQSIVQKYTDQSISNTFNLPSTCTPEQIGDLYFEAWKLGLKGVTVYRDGSREGVLVAEGTKKAPEPIPSINRRPKSLNAKVHVIKPNGKAYAVFVGMHNGRVFEVFALDNKQVGLVDGMEGTIFKDQVDGKKVYSFESGPTLVRQLNNYEDSDASIITRLVSTALRHGTPLEFVIDQMTKSKLLINTFPKAIAKALAHHVKPEETVGKFKCPQCKSTNILWEGLCRTCRDCGTSKCG